MSAPIPFGSYELLERIAEGGMAELWRARARGVAGFEKTVVIKRVLPSLLERPGFAELLVREAKIASRLSHPNVVQIYDLGLEEGGYYIAMELLRGRDLAAVLAHQPATESPLTLPLRLWIGSEVAKALDYAHRARGDDGQPLHIVHRDVSPQNVLLGYEGEVKVADFGIARADEPGLGRGEDPRVLRGKYSYMSPEQARGEPLDRRSDIFSFGIVLFELLARRRMFRGKTPDEALELLRRSALPPLPTDLPLAGLTAVLARALAPSPDERYGSAGELHDDLQRLLFSLGDPVGQVDLAAVMKRMFPPVVREPPTKLRVDVLRRAHEDAGASSDPARARPSLAPAVRTVPTLASPVRRRADTRRLALLAVRAGVDDDRRFGAVVEGTGGVPLPGAEGVLLAAFGLAGMERAVGHATRAALELRRQSRLEGVTRIELASPASIVAGEVQVREGSDVVPGSELLERALALLGRTDPAEVRLAHELGAELGRDFLCHAHEGDLVVDGFRARGAREAPVARGPLLGRRDVLRSLAGLLADTARGRGSLVHLLGEPGVGKSRVLAELRAAAAPKDFVFVHGRADEVEADRSFGLLADVVADLVGVEPDDAPATRFAKVERLRDLGLTTREVRLAGELLGLAYPWAMAARPGRPRGVELALALRRAIRALAGERAVVLVLEDLQWMEDATRQVLPLWLHALTRSRVLIVLARRTGSDEPLPPGGRTLEVSALDEVSAGALFGHRLGASEVAPDLARWVHAETGGVPGWIQLLAEPLGPYVRVVGGEAQLSRAPPTGLLPGSIRGMLVARIERLRPRDRSMLRTIAAMGGTVELRVASAVEGLVGHTARPVVRRLLNRRLLMADDGQVMSSVRSGAWGGDEEDAGLPPRVRMSSELLRRAVLAEMDPGELVRLHARIVRRLERVGGGEELEVLERLAEHALRANELASAHRYFLRAAGAAERAAVPEQAARHLVHAAALERAGDESSAGLALRAAELALSAGALEVADEALALASDASPTLAVHRARLRARCARRRHDPAAALRAFEDAPLDRVEASIRADAVIELARALLGAGRAAAAMGWLERVAADATGVALGRVHAARAEALAREDRLVEADEALSEAMALAAYTGDVALRHDALVAAGTSLEARAWLGPAARRYADAAELSSEGDSGERPRLHARAAVLYLAVGEPARAHEQASEAARHGPRTGWGLVAREVEREGSAPRQVEETLRSQGRREEAALLAELRAYTSLRHGSGDRRAIADAAEQTEIAGLRASARRWREHLPNVPNERDRDGP